MKTRLPSKRTLQEYLAENRRVRTKEYESGAVFAFDTSPELFSLRDYLVSSVCGAYVVLRPTYVRRR